MTNLIGFVGKQNVHSGWKHLYPTQNIRFPNKTVPISCHCEAAERPWQSLSQRHGIPWRGTGAEIDKIPRGRSEFHCKTIFTCPMGKFHMCQYLSLAQRANFTAQPCSAESRISLRSPNCALPRQAQRTVAANRLCGDRLIFLLNLLRPRASAPAGAYAAQRSRRPYGSPHDCPAAPCADSACRRSPRRRQRSHPHLGSSGRWRVRRFR